MKQLGKLFSYETPHQLRDLCLPEEAAMNVTDS